MTARLAALALAAALAACAPRELPMGPPVAAAHLSADRLVMADGLVLPMRFWLPEGQPKAVILGVHGFNDYSNAFTVAGPGWADQGIATYAYDQRGFGQAPNRGAWPGSATMVEDLATAARLIAAKHPGVPLFVMGESMGGAVTVLAATQDRLDHAKGIILIAPAVRGRAALGSFASAGLWLSAHTVPWLEVRPQVPGLMPSDNIAMLRRFSADPLVIKETRIDAGWGLVDLMDEAVAAAPRFDRPVLILLGANDDLVPPEPTLAWIDRLPAAPAAERRVALYARGYHMLLRDLQGPVVMADIAAWVLNRDTDPAASLPSGADAKKS